MGFDISEFENIVEDSAEEARPEDDQLATYCRDCEAIVEYKKRGSRKICAVCGGKELSLATRRSIRNVYNVK